MHDKRTKQLELNSKNISGLVGRDLIKPLIIFKENINKISACDQDTIQELEL